MLFILCQYNRKLSTSGRLFLRFVNLLNEKLLQALFCRDELSDEEEVQLLISWFNTRIQRQARETHYALEEAVCRLITGIDCSVFSTSFVTAMYYQRGSACALQRVHDSSTLNFLQ